MPVIVLLILHMLHRTQESTTHNIVLSLTIVAANKSERSQKTSRLTRKWWTELPTFRREDAWWSGTPITPGVQRCFADPATKNVTDVQPQSDRNVKKVEN